MRVRARPALIAPEVVQTSAMDCGPASLKCLLDGFGRPVSYGRLREACQTDVDGTSIDTLEDVAVQLGLEAEQVMIPVDHLLIPESRALPAIVVVRLAQGLTHFVVAWRRHGGLVQVMDPGSGRRWPRARAFLDELYIHTMPIAAADWREWAGSEEFLEPLTQRLAALGLTGRALRGLVDGALADPGAGGLSRLDATTRMVTAIVKTRGLRRGRQAQRVLESFLVAKADGVPEIPGIFWSAAAITPDEDGTERVLLRGAVLVRVLGTRPAALSEQTGAGAPATAAGGEAREAPAPLPPDLAAALNEPPVKPLVELLTILRRDGLTTPLALSAALVSAALAVVFQALLFRGLLELPRFLGAPEQRLGAAMGLIVFLAALFLLELPIKTSLLRLGRHLEVRLRVAFQEKIPRLGDRYFNSRLTSDMAERAHALPALRGVPDLGARLVRSLASLTFTTLGIAWLDPAGAPIAAAVAVLSVVLPLASQRLLAERDLRIRTHAGALTRFYLDALLGLVAVRAHGAQRSLRREHESLLVEWVKASLSLLRASVAVEVILSLLGMTLAGALLFFHLSRAGEASMVLLLVYWALQLPALGGEVAAVALAYPSTRNVTLRLIEPLGALEEGAEGHGMEAPAPEARGVSVRLEGVSAMAGGHELLHGVSLEVAPGSQVAIVGQSGAGKSSLVGLLLGWTRPSEGRVLVDGVELDADQLERLRGQTAWVDPAVQLWNRPFVDNLTYGNEVEAQRALAEVIEQASLKGILEGLPEGLQTTLGEGGALVSGGEGQRVRFGRALLRREARLVILDEAFRGLDRGARRALLARAREWWRGATLICVSHDIAETMGFDEVLVVEDGEVIERGSPEELARRPGSRYAELLEAERAVTSGMWDDPGWRRVRLERGKVFERAEERRG